MAIFRSWASMRPRQSSLGIIPSAARPARCSTRFNEAEAIKPRNPTGTTDQRGLLSRFNEAEAIKPRNQCRSPKLFGYEEASMRPRQSSLGISGSWKVVALRHHGLQ